MIGHLINLKVLTLFPGNSSENSDSAACRLYADAGFYARETKLRPTGHVVPFGVGKQEGWMGPRAMWFDNSYVHKENGDGERFHST